MHKILTLVVLALVLVDLSIAQKVPEQPAVREKLWQEYLENRKFSFLRDEYCSMMSSVDNFSANCHLHIVLTPPPESAISFKFIREGKELLTLPGNYESTFRTADEKLYFAHFSSKAAHCTVSSYDLTTGKELWKTDDISRVGGGGSSGYINKVLLRLSRKNEVPNEPKGATIILTGNQVTGHYIAILDRETGKRLAHKIYGKNFWRPPLTDRERADGRF